MGKEIYVKIVGGISFLLALGFLVSSALFLASTGEFKLDAMSCSNWAKRNYYHGGSRNSDDLKFQLLRQKRYDHSRSGWSAESQKEHNQIQTSSRGFYHTNTHANAHSPKPNSWYNMFFGLCIAGILLSILQISASFLGCCANKKTGRRLSILWMFTNMILVIGLIIIFALSMYYYQPCFKKGLSKGVANQEWLAFTVIVAINAFLSLVLISYSYFALKSKHYEYENYATTTDNSSRSDERQKLTNVYTSNVRSH